MGRFGRVAALLACAVLLPRGARGGPAALQLFDVASDPEAVCNDGSAAGYYYAPAASAADGNVWLVMLEGGEWCYDAASCAQRLAGQAALMTSKNWKATTHLSGVFDSNPVKSPFAAVHKVYVPYCSSDAWVGDTQAGGLRFKGQRIVAAVLRALVAQRGLGAAPGDRLLFGGCSAGARGAMFNLDYMQELLPPGVQLQGFLDSPLWIDVAPLASAPLSFQCQAQAAVGYLNATARLGADCVAAYPSPADAWRCVFGQFRMPFLRTPYALNAAQYDSFQIEANLGGTMPPKTPGQIAYADAFGDAMRNVVSGLPTAQQSGSGVFSGACFKHCVTLSAEFWSVASEGVSLSEAVRWWFFGGCPAEECPGGQLPDQVIEDCGEGYQRCKAKCTLKHSTKGGKRKVRPPKVMHWAPGDATPPAPSVPLACDAGPPVPVLPSRR